MKPIKQKLQPLLSPKQPNQSNDDLIRAGNIPSRFRQGYACIKLKAQESPSRDNPDLEQSPAFNSIEPREKRSAE